MSIYFNENSIHNQNDVTDCVYSSNTNNFKKIKSIWGLKDSKVTKLWEYKETDPYDIAPDSEYLKWDYTLDEEKNTITLKYYKSTARGVRAIVYSNYEINGKIYKTKIASNDTNATSKYMFISSYAYEIIFSPNIDTSETENMSYMFYNCSAQKIDLNGLNTKNVTNMSHMFAASSSLAKDAYINFGKNFNTENVTNMSYMFHACNCYNLDLETFDTSNVIDMANMFYGSKAKSINFGKNFNTENVTNMKSMFNTCSLTSIDLSNFSTSNVTDMSYMFYKYSGTSLDLSNFNTNKLINMSYMFNESKLLEDISFGNNFDTSNVTNMLSMFGGCISLTSIDLSSFDTRNVINMTYMFGGCNNLILIYVSENFWITSQANITNMFKNCGTSSVTYK